jgi:hypothetical protein
VRAFRWLLAWMIVVPAVVSGQSMVAQKHQATAPPAEARFEIIQSSFVAKLTLRLDRFTGAVDQLMTRPDSTIGWEPIVRRSHRDPDTQVAGRANYQIFTSGLAIRYTFLINVTSGATWELVEDRTSGWFWIPIF